VHGTVEMTCQCQGGNMKSTSRSGTTRSRAAGSTKAIRTRIGGAVRTKGMPFGETPPKGGGGVR
jgi:hypothetical protein